MGGGPASSSAPQLLATRQPLLSSVSRCGSVHPCHLQTFVLSPWFVECFGGGPILFLSATFWKKVGWQGCGYRIFLYDWINKMT